MLLTSFWSKSIASSIAASIVSLLISRRRYAVQGQYRAATLRRINKMFARIWRIHVDSALSRRKLARPRKLRANVSSTFSSASLLTSQYKLFKTAQQSRNWCQPTTVSEAAWLSSLATSGPGVYRFTKAGRERCAAENTLARSSLLASSITAATSDCHGRM